MKISVNLHHNFEIEVKLSICTFVFDIFRKHICANMTFDVFQILLLISSFFMILFFL